MSCPIYDLYQRNKIKPFLTIYQSVDFSIPGFIMKYPTFQNIETKNYSINELGMPDSYLEANRVKLSLLYSRSYILISLDGKYDFHMKTIGTIVQISSSSMKKLVILTNYSLIKPFIDITHPADFKVYIIDPQSTPVNLHIIFEELEYIVKIVNNVKEKETRFNKFIEEYHLEQVWVDQDFFFKRTSIIREYTKNDPKKKTIMPYFDLLAFVPPEKFHSLDNHITIELNDSNKSVISVNEKKIITISHIPVNYLYRNIEKNISINESYYFQNILFNPQMLSISLGVISTQAHKDKNYAYGNYYQSNYLPGGLIYNPETLSPIGLSFIQNNYEDYSLAQYTNIYIPFYTSMCLQLFNNYLDKNNNLINNCSLRKNNLFLTTTQSVLFSNSNSNVYNSRSNEINICSFIAKEPNDNNKSDQNKLTLIKNDNNIFGFYSQVLATSISNNDATNSKPKHKQIIINSTPTEEELLEMKEKLQSKINSNSHNRDDPVIRLIKKQEDLRESILNLIDQTNKDLLQPSNSNSTIGGTLSPFINEIN